MLSLEVDGGKIRVLTGKCKHNIAIISDYLEVDFGDEASLLDDGQTEKMGIMLRNALKERQIRDKKSVVSLRGSDLFFRRVTLPSARPAQLKEMVSHSLNGILTVKDYYVDYMVEREQIVDGKKRLEVLLCGVPKHLANAYYSMFMAAELIPHRMDAQQNYVQRLLGVHNEINGESLKGRAVLLLDTGNFLLGANLFVDGKSIFEHTISVQPQGSLDFSDELSGFNMFSFGAAGFDDTNPLYTRIYDEAQKMMQFSLTRALKTPVTGVYLYGENSSNHELVQYLAESLGVPVEPLSEVMGIKFENGYSGPGICSIFGFAAALL